MIATLKRLAPAAVAAALLAAPAARADHALPPAPAYAPAPPPGNIHAPRAWRGAPPVLRADRGRIAWLRLQGEYRELERARAEFYATWRGNPWRQRRFESWYASRRAELDRRSEWLSQRGWGHRGERFAWNHDDHD